MGSTWIYTFLNKSFNILKMSKYEYSQREKQKTLYNLKKKNL